MSGSTTSLDLIQQSQAQHDVVANALHDASSPAKAFARRASTSAGLTWGYYGGNIYMPNTGSPSGNNLISVSNGTLALTGSATCYVRLTQAGVVEFVTSIPAGWPDSLANNAIALYTIITNASGVSPVAWPTGGYDDHRVAIVGGPATGSGGGGGGGGSPTGSAGGDLTGTYPNPTIAANAVTNAKAAQMAAHTFKGNNTASTANAIDLTLTQATAEINAMVGDSGAGGTKGQVPAPAAGDAAAGKFLKADGTWAVPGAASDKTFSRAISDETTTLTVGVAKLTFRMPYAMTLTGVRASLNQASSSGTPTFDINETSSGSPASPVSILSTKITIDVGERTSTTAAIAAVISDSSLADDAEITIDIDVAGTGAKGAKITFIGT